jgi:hypothetical protein
MKLYRKSPTSLEYWEAWESDGTTVVHWGRVGERGETVELAASPSRSWLKKFWQRCIAATVRGPASLEGLPREVLKEQRRRQQQGFVEIPIEEHATLLIEYRVDGMGSAEDLDKRHRLEDLLNELLGWTGLGICDGGSIGSGTMEACCFVVDFEIARRVIAETLQGTDFQDYSRIYDDSA